MTTSSTFALCGSGRRESLFLSRLGARVARRAGRAAATDAVRRVLTGHRPQERLTGWQAIDLRLALVLVEVNATTLTGRPHSTAWIQGWTEVARAVGGVIETCRAERTAPLVAEVLDAVRSVREPQGQEA